jgi:hypothetical protein
MLRESKTVSVLLCHVHVPMALECLGSLLRLSAEPLELRIHDDGTLTAGDRSLLAARLGRVQIVTREEADDLIAGRYGGYLHLRHLRLHYPPIMKAFDAAVLSSGPVIALVDSDVLFVQRLCNPFRLTEPGVHAVFMRDREHAYSLRSWQKVLARGVALPARVNSGFVCFDRARYDLDRLEWFVSQARHRGIPPVLEQTALAWLGHSVGCGVLDPGQVRVMREGEPAAGLVAGHFTARTRHLVPAFAALSRRADLTAPPADLRVVDAGTCTALDLARYEARRILRRLAA